MLNFLFVVVMFIRVSCNLSRATWPIELIFEINEFNINIPSTIRLPKPGIEYLVI